MKTIKELEAKIKRTGEYFERGQLQALKDVLGLIDEMIEIYTKSKQYAKRFAMQRLKARIKGK